MTKTNRTNILLLLIFTFAFLYRLVLTLWEGFPPGADIGLHNSVIYSIIGSGNTDFCYNLYHMGGGVSLTFPGYHIFTAAIIILTGLPELFAHTIIVSLFSALIVLCAYLVTKRVWSTSAGFIVAFFVAISRFDIEMILWAGYPNVLALMLIPLTFYLYLEKDRFSKIPFFVTTTIIVGSLFLTHSLSAGIFTVITFIVIFLILILPKKIGTNRKTALYWLLPVILGFVLVSPFLVDAIPAYISENAYSAGHDDIAEATFSTRVLPLWIVLPLYGVIPAFLIFSKKYYKKILTLPSLLLSIWVCIPLSLTLIYFIKIPFDYNRFLYFIMLPVMIFIAVLVEYGSSFLSGAINTYRGLIRQKEKLKNTSHRKLWRFPTFPTHKTVYSIFILFFLLFSFGLLPIFMTPSQNFGQTIQSYYQTMNNESMDAIKWAKQNTPEDSVFVSDALYGWWFSGFAQRKTLSAVDPQYLSLNREFEPSQFARYLLDTDYLLENELIQVRDDGYLARHNPEILAKLNWTYFPYSFFNFGSDKIQIQYRITDGLDNNLQSVFVDQLKIRETCIENHTQNAIIKVSRFNDYLNYTQFTTIYEESKFVNFTIKIESTNDRVSLDWVSLNVESKGKQIDYDNDSTIGLIDVGVKTFGQLILNPQPYDQVVSDEITTTIDLLYCLEGKSRGNIEILVSAYSATNNPDIYSNPNVMNSFFVDIMTNNLQTKIVEEHKDISDDKKTIFLFDYYSDMKNYDVSYIACRDTELQPKFFLDPAFSLVFINKEVAIFRVNSNLN